MKVAGLVMRKSLVVLMGGLVGAGLWGGSKAAAQAPYLVPYTIQILAGGGTAPAVGASCTGTNGVVGMAFDTQGDGCPVSSGAVTVGVAQDLHDVVVDAQGNIYFLDNTSAVGVVRRIDARSGIVNIYLGNLTPAQPKSACTNVMDKYGDGCQANDGMGNVTPTGTPAPPYLYTGNLGRARGLGIAPNGNLYYSNYSNDLVQLVSKATGIFSNLAGSISQTGAANTRIGTMPGYTGDGGQATSALLHSNRGVTADAAGNVYIADTTNNVIRMVNSSGVISTIVGSKAGTAGATGDGGPASAATLSGPEDVEVDAAGDLYIADQTNSRIRLVYNGGAAAKSMITAVTGSAPAVGNIYTVMGGPTPTAAGATPPAYTNGSVVPASSLPISGRKIALDALGNLYVADNNDSVIWLEDATTGYMRTIAGTYFVASNSTAPAPTPCAGASDSVGDNCPGTQSYLFSNADMGVAVDATGNVLVSDSGDRLLRRVSTNQLFGTVTSGGSMTQTLVVHYGPGDTSGTYTIGGSADFKVTPGNCNAKNADSTVDCPVTVTFAPTQPGADLANLAVVSSKGKQSNFVLSGTGVAAAVALDPGNATMLSSGLKGSLGLAFDAAGNTFIADTGNNRVLKVSAAGATTTFAGTGTTGYTGDGTAAATATLNAPAGVTVTQSGAVFIADTGNNVIRRVDPISGLIATVAGNASAVCPQALDAIGDGCSALAATLAQPSGLAADSDGNVYISDSGNNVVRELTLSGSMVAIANGFSAPAGLAIDAGRNLYVADTGNNYVKEILANGTVTVVAGTGSAMAGNTTGKAISAPVIGPRGVAVDAAGNVYLADTGNAAVRVVSQGQISNIVGVIGAPGTGTLPGSAYAVQLVSPGAVAVTSEGNLVVLDSGNNRAIAVNRDATSINFGTTKVNSPSPTAQINETATGNSSATLGSSMQFTTTGSAGSFTLLPSGSNGCNTTTSLTPQSSCQLVAQFNPTTVGTQTATFTESQAMTVNTPVPAITLTGTGAVLTDTSSTTAVTTPASGSPQYAVPFVVTTTVTPSACNANDPACMPTGTVTFFADGNQVLLPVTLSAKGTASETIAGLSVGAHTIKAVYSGDANYAGSTSIINITLAKGVTTVAVTVPASTLQFTPITISAQVSTAVSGVYPTGSLSFYIGGKLLSLPCLVGGAPVTSVPVSTVNGKVTVSDPFVPSTTAASLCLVPAQMPAIAPPTSFNLAAGTYALTAVFTSGDTNYANSTSVVANLVIAPDPVGLSSSLSTAATGTAQGSTAQAMLTVNPTNTFSGAVTFSCTGMPANSDCTFSPVSLNFAAVSGPVTTQSTLVTFFTDVPAGVLPTARNTLPAMHSNSGAELASVLGWPVLLTSLIGLAGIRRKLAAGRLLTLLALVGVLVGGSVVVSGCGSGSSTAGGSLTPIGTYKVQVIATASGGVSVSAPITFTVAAGLPGQL